MKIDQEALRSVVEKVMSDLGQGGASRLPAAAPTAATVAADSSKGDCGCQSGSGRASGFGVFNSVNEAANAAHEAFLSLRELGVEGRARVIEIVFLLA